MRYRGSLVALVTPMAAGVEVQTAIDVAGLERLVEFHVEQGSDALVAVGTTGESATLTPEEHCEVIGYVIEFARRRIPVIAGTGANSTLEALHFTRRARDMGADACLLVTPYYNKPTQEGLYRHFATVAEQVDIPQILYNVPARTACDMLPETVGRLARLRNVIGIKEATGDISRVKKLRELCGDDFVLLSGDDATALEFMLAGGHGVISVTANVAPRVMHEMCMAALSGETQRARELDARLQPLHRDLFVEANPIPVKWAAEQLGLLSAGIRLPLTWLSEGARPKVRAALQAAGVVH
jgi:4-hydroxy-tetrahydrodipicolinate synthase